MKSVREKINDITVVCKQNLELAQRLYIFFLNKEIVFEILHILFVIFFRKNIKNYVSKNVFTKKNERKPSSFNI